MHYRIVKDMDEMGRIAADIFAAQIQAKPDSVLGLATGSSPLPLYAELVKRSRAGEMDFRRVRTANLDEYVGLGPAHPQSYRFFMQENLFDHIPVDFSNTALPDGMADDLAAACREYDARIAAWGGVDLQLLGIGHNGHIGFNEPGAVFRLRTHVVSIAARTRLANARFFGDDPEQVPAQAITMGIGNIMSARKIVLMVSGENKAEIVRRAFFEDVTPEVPASILQLHGDVTLITDEQAAYRAD